MLPHWQMFSWLISLVWFLLYWILGGVFFSLVALLRLGRVRKVRFSCLFTLLCAIVASGASWLGLRASAGAVAGCVVDAGGRLGSRLAMFSCGFATMLGAFLIGAGIVVIIGFLCMALSRPSTPSWIAMGQGDPEVDEDVTSG